MILLKFLLTLKITYEVEITLIMKVQNIGNHNQTIMQHINIPIITSTFFSTILTKPFFSKFWPKLMIYLMMSRDHNYNYISSVIIIIIIFLLYVPLIAINSHGKPWAKILQQEIMSLSLKNLNCLSLFASERLFLVNNKGIISS